MKAEGHLKPPLPILCAIHTGRAMGGLGAMIVTRGLPGFVYYPTISAEVFNDEHRVSPAIQKAMMVGAVLGWTHRLADPTKYDHSGELIDPDA